MAKKKAKAAVGGSKVYNGYTLANADKLNRAIFGSTGERGALSGGVGEDASPEEVLAAYDRLGGLILKGSAKVKTGSFWDFEEKEARKEPEVTLVFRDLKGRLVEIAEDEEVPVEVQAAEKIREEEEEELKAGAAKAKAKKEAAKAKAKTKGKKKGEEEGEEEELSGEEDEVDEDVE